jgi:hypothetical protein
VSGESCCCQIPVDRTGSAALCGEEGEGVFANPSRRSSTYTGGVEQDQMMTFRSRAALFLSLAGTVINEEGGVLVLQMHITESNVLLVSILLRILKTVP